MTNKAVRELRERIELLDALEAHPRAFVPFEERLRLEEANQHVIDGIRQEILAGRGCKALLEYLPDVFEVREGYDYLDEIVAGVLRFGEIRGQLGELAKEMVFYQPTPARHIFDLILRVKPGKDDLLVDLGSGLGHVPLLVNICTEARCIGVEQEIAYVECARDVAARLGLTNVTFQHGEASLTDLSEGTVFYLYTPFKGTMLRKMLGLLREQASQRKICVCTFGPCVTDVTEESWLTTSDEVKIDRITVFHSR